MNGADIFAALSPVFGGRVHPNTGPFDATRPVCIYQRVGCVSISTFCGETVKKNSQYQVWVWADRAETAETLMDTVSGLLTAPPLRGVPQGSASGAHNEMERVHGLVQTFSFWG